MERSSFKSMIALPLFDTCDVRIHASVHLPRCLPGTFKRQYRLFDWNRLFRINSGLSVCECDALFVGKLYKMYIFFFKEVV